MPQVLIVDPSPERRAALALALAGLGAAASPFASWREPGAAEAAADAVVAAAALSGGADAGRAAAAQALKRASAALVITPEADRQAAAAALAAGAGAVLVAPVAPRHAARAALSLLAPDPPAQRSARRAHAGAGAVARSPAMRAAFDAVRPLVRGAFPLALVGEAGSGREDLARRVHAASPRADGPFVTLRCAGIEPSLALPLLLGAERGRWPGGDRRRSGKLAEAGGGMLFLDDPARLPRPAQAALARVLLEGEAVPAGGAAAVPLAARVILSLPPAEHEDPGAADEAAAALHPALAARIRGFAIPVPPLRDRREDLAALARLALGRAASAAGAPALVLAAAAEQALMVHDWPGNLPELAAVLAAALRASDGDVVTRRDLPRLVGGGRPRRPPPVDDGATKGANGAESGESPPCGPDCIRIAGPDGHVRALAEIEEDVIRAAHDRYGGNVSEVARRLGIGRSTLYRRRRPESDEGPGA